MKKIIATLALCLTAATAQANLINFEDAGLPAQSSNTAAWDGSAYGFNSNGFHFSNADVIDLSGTVPWWAAGVGSAYSGNYAGFNDWSGTITMTKVGGGTFSLDDFWSAGWQGAAGNLTATGYLGGLSVGSHVFSYNNTWQNFDLNFAQVDKVTFDGGLFFLEDLTADGNNNPVPEPSTFILLGAGLAGLGFARRRFVKK